MAWYGTVTVSIGDYTKASDHEKLRESIVWLRTKADVDHDFDATTGTGYHRASIAAPAHIRVDGSTVWSVGWWQAAGGSWWQLVRMAEVSSFTRGEANFYVPTRPLKDVPDS